MPLCFIDNVHLSLHGLHKLMQNLLTVFHKASYDVRVLNPGSLQPVNVQWGRHQVTVDNQNSLVIFGLPVVLANDKFVESMPAKVHARCSEIHGHFSKIQTLNLYFLKLIV